MFRAVGGRKRAVRAVGGRALVSVDSIEPQLKASQPNPTVVSNQAETTPGAQSGLNQIIVLSSRLNCFDLDGFHGQGVARPYCTRRGFTLKYCTLHWGSTIKQGAIDGQGAARPYEQDNQPSIL